MLKKGSGWIFRLIAGVLLLIAFTIAFAYIRTWNKLELEFSIRLNPELIQISAYGEPPTFAIWLENRKGELENIYVTHRAYENDWEGKPEVPVALPYWFHLNESGKFHRQNEFLSTDAISGATPREDLFVIRVEVPPDSTYLCWIEMNLSGDYNDFYKETDPVSRTSDEYGNGQPALVYFGKIEAVPGQVIEPEIFGMSIRSDSSNKIIYPVKGITNADRVFSNIQVQVVHQKPYIFKLDY